MRTVFLLFISAIVFSCKKECPEIQKPKLDLQLISYSEEKSADTAIFTINVRATATGIDYYVGMGAGSAGAIGATSAGFIFAFQKPDLWIDNMRTIGLPQCKTTAKVVKTSYKVEKGKSEDFSIIAKIPVALTGQYRMMLRYVRYTYDPDDVVQLMQEVGTDVFRTDYLML